MKSLPNILLTVVLSALFGAGMVLTGEAIGLELAKKQVTPPPVAAPAKPCQGECDLQVIYDHAVKVKVVGGWGTGFVCRGLDPWGDQTKVWVVTAAHVAERPGDKVELLHEAGATSHLTAGVVRFVSDESRGQDFALIEPQGNLYRPETIPTVSLLKGGARLGETVWYAGCLDSTHLSVEKGIVSNTDFVYSDYMPGSMYMINGIGLPGSSGTSVFVCRPDGLKLAGLLVAGWRSSAGEIQNQSWTTRAEDIQKYLDQVAKDNPKWLP